MKTLKLIAAGIILLASSSIHAQVSVNVNIGSAPAWAPAGYSEAEYYYLPDVEAYYDVRATQFIYYGNGSWIRSRSLPRQYRNYDLYSGRTVVLNDYHGSRPYNNFRNHKVKYYRGYNGNRPVVYNNNRRVYVSDRHHSSYKKYDNHREYRKHDNKRDNHDHGRKNSHARGHDRD